MAALTNKQSREEGKRMYFRLQLMCRHNAALSPQELAASDSYSGNFILENQNQIYDGHKFRKARLVDPASSTAMQDIAPPLFNAEIVSVDNNQIMVCGYCHEFDANLGKEVRHRQCWLLRFISDAMSPEIKLKVEDGLHTLHHGQDD